MSKLSTALANAVLATGSLKSLLDGGFLYLYAGPVPASADAAKDASAVKVAKIAVAGVGVTFDTTPSGGALGKASAETWSGSALAAGTVTHFRFCKGADDGSAAAGASDYRAQGTAGVSTGSPGTDPDLVLQTSAIDAGSVITIDAFNLDLSGVL